MNVACTEQVSAGNTGASGRAAPARARAASRGVCGPRWRGLSPTTRITSVGRMRDRSRATAVQLTSGDHTGKSRHTRVERRTMTVAALGVRWLTALAKLGRVSNLPTVWTNVLAATVLADGDWRTLRTGLVLVAMSLFYVGGMYLNDYFDRAIDARERPTRPIPAGDLPAGTVAAIGFALLAGGVAALAPLGGAALLAGWALALTVVGYDVWHKGNPAGPVVMGLCRALVYAGAAAAVMGGVPPIVVLAALAMLAYVAGITYAAQQESYDRIGSLWPLAALYAPAVV